MSTFSGKLFDPAVNFMAIDHFGEHVYDCEVFLLSHHHCDHMQGIYASELAKVINESSKKVYCSPLTAHFLRKNRSCSINHDRIVALEINKPFVVPHDFSNISTLLVVTCLPASHCPGSVMFLIEYNNKRVLYSGDIRLTLDDLRNIVGTVSNADGSAIKIDELYLDTTFAVPTVLEDFPSREDSERVIIDFIKGSLSVSPHRKITLEIAAKFGYESLYINLYKAFKKPIAVHADVLSCYEDIEEMSDYVTSLHKSRDDEWLIHACRGINGCKIAENSYIIKPCALGFVKSSNKKITANRKYNVPYSKQSFATKIFYATHCSLNELRDICEYLTPDRVYPSVKVDLSLSEILRLIGITKKPKNEKNCTGLRVLPSLPKQTREEYERERSEYRKQLGF